MLDLCINLLIIQALMGAFDTLYHHEFKVGLPRCPSAALELRIHAVRALLYGLIFFGLAWFQWGGFWSVFLISMILIEVVLTLWDFVIEDKTRILPGTERVTHTLLAINGGAAFVLLALELPNWIVLATELNYVDYGWRSWFLTLSALGVAFSGIRDGLAAWALKRLELPLSLELGGHRRILIAGGTGFIGSTLCRSLIRMGHEVTVLSRSPVSAVVQFGGKARALRSTHDLSTHQSFDVIVNLAGAPVVGLPWSAKRKREIANSRLQATKDLVEFARNAQKRPTVWIQASAVGYYGTKNDKPMDETSSAGQGFAAELCQNWEDLTSDIEKLGVRCVILRFGLVFARSGGALPMMLMPFRIGLGAILGDGKQHISWIHIEDLLQLIAYSIRDDSLQGYINAVAPDHPQYSEFANLVGKLIHRPVLLRIPAGLLRRLLGEMASMFIDGPVISPKRLQNVSYEYRFPSIRSALMDLS